MCTIAVWDKRAPRAAELADVLRAFSSPSHRVIKLGAAPSIEEIRPCDVVIISYDLKYETALTVAQTVRKESKQAVIVIIAAAQEAILPLIRPSVRAGGAIIRPFERQELFSLLEEAKEELRRAQPDEAFVIKTGGAGYRFAPADICFFEAVGKKIVLRTAGQEVAFYDTLENLETRLPPYFLKCHRGYLVNSRMIKSVRFAENLICLKNGGTLPLSRSFKAAVREWMENT